MMETCFLVQIKRTSGVFEKGVVVKENLIAARQSYHAYLGAYGYNHDEKTDYVACYIISADGIVHDWVIDNRIPAESEPSEAE